MGKRLKQYQRIISFDLKEGIIRKFYVYIICFLVIGIFLLDARYTMALYMDAPGVSDILLYLFRGMEEYIPKGPEDAFIIPYQYLTIFILMGLTACYYPHKEWKLRGRLYLTRYYDKRIWWAGKCVWNLVNSLLMYLFVFVTAWAIAGAGGNGGIKIGEGTAEAMEWELLTGSSKEVLWYVIVLGFLTVTALNQLQITLQMLVSPIFGFIAVLAVLISSAYYFHPLFMGNHLMVLRTVLVREDGISLGFAAGYSIAVWLGCVILGGIIVKRKDVL